MKNENRLKKMLAVLLAVCFLSTPAASLNPLGAATAEAQEYLYDRRFSQEQLDNLLAPIALYPDPLLAQVLVAATFVDQVEDAARWMRAYNDPYGIDGRPWDVSVKAVAHYPSILYMMAERIDWTTALGQAYVDQSTDVMASVQHLRAMAYSAGNLASNRYQEVIDERDYIEVVPYQPEYIYVPAYDPGVVFVERAYFYPVVVFGPPLLIGAWLNRDCDWRGRRIFYHGWHGGGWIERSRPHVRITDVYVNNNYTNVRFNRDVVRRRVNVENLNRFAGVHRDVNFSNRSRDNWSDRGGPNAGDRTIRRGEEDAGRDSFHGRPLADRRATREPGAPQAREDRSPPAWQGRPAQALVNRSLQARKDSLPQARVDRSRGAREEISPQTRENRWQRVREETPPQARVRPQPSTDFRQPPRGALRDNGSFDPRANREREQFSRTRAHQPAPSPATNASRPQAKQARDDRRKDQERNRG